MRKTKGGVLMDTKGFDALPCIIVILLTAVSASCSSCSGGLISRCCCGFTGDTGMLPSCVSWRATNSIGDVFDDKRGGDFEN